MTVTDAALTLAMVVRPVTSPRALPEAHDIQVSLDVVAKQHHHDDAGTVDVFGLGELSPFPMRLGDLESVRRQVRRLLAERAHELACAAHTAGVARDMDADEIARLPLEIDLDDALAQRLGSHFPINQSYRSTDPPIETP